MKIMKKILLILIVAISVSFQSCEEYARPINDTKMNGNEKQKCFIVKGKYQNSGKETAFFLVDSNRNVYNCIGIDYALVKEGDTFCIKITE